MAPVRGMRATEKLWEWGGPPSRFSWAKGPDRTASTPVRVSDAEWHTRRSKRLRHTVALPAGRTAWAWGVRGGRKREGTRQRWRKNMDKNPDTGQERGGHRKDGAGGKTGRKTVTAAKVRGVITLDAWAKKRSGPLPGASGGEEQGRVQSV